MRPLVRAVAAAALAAGAILIPAYQPDGPGPAAAVDAPPLAICAVEQGGAMATRVGVQSTVGGEGSLSVFGAGAVSGTAGFDTQAGPVSVAIGDVSAIGTAAAMVELPDDESAAASVIGGPGIIAIETCPASAPTEALLGGGSTLDERTFVVQLMNPFAGEAIVDLAVRSDAGLESNPDLEGILVPARSSVLVDLAEMLPGREWLTVAIEAQLGGVVAAGRFGAGSDQALWTAVEPQQDWFVPVPHGLSSRQVVIVAGNADVEYQVDFYGPDGLDEAFAEGQIDARGQAVVDVSDVTPVASAVRVISTGPVAAFLRVSQGGAMGMTAGSPVAASTWLLPDAGSVGGSSGYLVLLNTGLEPIEATVETRGQSQPITIPAERVFEMATASEPVPGYVVESGGPLVVGWSATTDSAVAVSGGAALPDE